MTWGAKTFGISHPSIPLCCRSYNPASDGNLQSNVEQELEGHKIGMRHRQQLLELLSGGSLFGFCYITAKDSFVSLETENGDEVESIGGAEADRHQEMEVKSSGLVCHEQRGDERGASGS